MRLEFFKPEQVIAPAFFVGLWIDAYYYHQSDVYLPIGKAWR